MKKVGENLWMFLYLSFLLFGCGFVIGFIVDHNILINGGIKTVLIVSLVGGLVFTLATYALK